MLANIYKKIYNKSIEKDIKNGGTQNESKQRKIILNNKSN